MLRVFNDATQQRLGEMIVHASKLGILSQLIERLQYLSTYGADPDDHGTYNVCQLFYDSAEYSVGFTMYKTEFDGDGNEELKFWFNGLLGFHPGSTGPDKSMSVSLSTSDAPRFEVHT